MSKRIARRLDDATPRVGSSYPVQFQNSVEGRGKWPLGDLFGLDQFGVNLTELAPGAASALRHWHSAEDEFVYILEGSPVLVTDAGEETLSPGDCVGFKAGVEDGHCLINRTDHPIRYLEIGSRRLDTDRVGYPDVDLAVEPDTNGGRRFVHRDGTAY